MKIVIATVAGLAVAASAGVQTEGYSGSFSLATTNWNQSFQIAGFDTQNGNRELVEVNIRLAGEVQGDAKAESLDAAPAEIFLALQATLTLELMATNTQLAEVIPVVNTSFNADAFDGSIDFGGTSGVSLLGLQGFGNVNESSTDAGVLAQFSDVAFVDLIANADGSSFGSGAGNLITQFATAAALEYEVEYKYRLVPTPGAASLLAVGGLAFIRRRR
jgi:hypothetical protein